MIAKIKQLYAHEGFMKYFKNTSWLFAEKILRMFVGLFVGIWIARYLGPEKFGLLSYAQSFVGLFMAFATLGLDSIVIRELVKDESRKNELLGTSFWLKLVGAVLLLGFLSIAILVTSNDTYTNSLIFIIASATIFQAFNVVDFYFQAKVLSKYIVFANIISLLLSSIIKIALILSNAPLEAFAWMVLFDSMVLACGFIYFYLYKKEKITSWTFKKEVAISLLKDSWPLIFSSIMVSIYMRIDQVMIKEMLNSEAVGQYSAAVRLSEAWYFIPVAISSSLFPAIINAKQISEEFYYKRLQKLYTLMVWMAIVIALPMTFLSDFVINLLYGDKYNEASGVLMVHVWGGIFVFLGVAFQAYLIAENFVKKSFFRASIGAISNIFFNFVLIPKTGINGAAIATLLSYAMADYIFDIFDRKLQKHFILKTKCFFPVYIFKK